VRETTLTEAVPQQSAAALQDSHGQWIGWVPVIFLPSLTIALRSRLLPWVFMWLLAVAIFAGCKWQTWWQARVAGLGAGNWKRSAAYLLLWPGMDAPEFFDGTAERQRIPSSEWFKGIAKTVAGIALIWAGARIVSLGHPMAGGWVGMIGLLLFLHFGTFHLLALVWQRAGLGVKPIMQRPLASHSLSELWGKRWNLGFRALSHTSVFQPLQKRFGLVAGTLGAFLASGLLHELVISVPAGAGYGLPTVYFLVQGIGVIAERTEAGRQLGFGRGAGGWLWTALIAAGPLYALFHPWFVMRVIVPFLRAVAG
jgi:membrane bound O-acyltransferase family protein